MRFCLLRSNHCHSRVKCPRRCLWSSLTVIPVRFHSVDLSLQRSDAPSLSPSLSPTFSQTVEPTLSPTMPPTVSQSHNPTLIPTMLPTRRLCLTSCRVSPAHSHLSSPHHNHIQPWQPAVEPAKFTATFSATLRAQGCPSVFLPAIISSQ